VAVEEPASMDEAVLAYVEYEQTIDADGLPVLGDLDAPVSVTLYSSFTCPSCANFNADSLPTLVEEYVATGQINLTFAPILIPSTDDGLTASAIALCLAQQSLFWDYHDAVFAVSRADGASEGVSEAVYDTFAAQFPVDREQTQACVTDETVFAAIEQAEQAASAAGLSGVPSVQVNGGDLIPGFIPDMVITEIEAALAGS
jgi:protein-disulfide isomerase